MQEPILIARDLVKTYGALTAVDGISFSIARGEVFGLLGPNGAGKTTTLSMLATLIEPTSGEITIAGLDPLKQSSGVKGRLGLVPQELALYPTLSARDNLNFFGRIYGLSGRHLRQRVDAVLEMVGLSERARDRIETYSGGMKRRINIAAGLLHEPEVLFLDEPTVGVDPQSRNAIFESIEALNKGGLTILYTTHYMEEAERLCDRIAIVDHGQVIALDTPGALMRSLGDGLLRVGLHNGHVEDVARLTENLAAAKSVIRQDGMLMVQTRQAQEALVGLLEITHQLDARVNSLEILEPNLETVFLQLTGKSLRDN